MSQPPVTIILPVFNVDGTEKLSSQDQGPHVGGKRTNAQDLDLSNCYLRQTDLRGIDLSTARLEGASINGAKISGTYFPKALSPEEITLSLVHGTRLRYR